MISAKYLGLSALAGVMTMLIVSRLFLYGFNFYAWNFSGPRIGELVMEGAAVGVAAGLIGQIARRK